MDLEGQHQAPAEGRPRPDAAGARDASTEDIKIASLSCRIEPVPAASQIMKPAGIGQHLQAIENGTGQVSCRIISNGTPVNVKYNGEWMEGRRAGKGCLSTNLPSEYNGEWMNGRRHGRGRQIYPSGNVYEGQWSNDVKSGRGIMKWIDQQQVYEGEWKSDQPDGYGVQVWFQSCPGIDLRKIKSLAELQDRFHFCNRYRGEFRNGQRHGQGVFFYSSGAVYRGSWAHNLKHGPGTFTHINGQLEAGVWDHDVIRPSCDSNLDVADEHPTTSLGFHVQCEDLLPMQSSPTVFSDIEMVSTILLRYNDDLRRIFYLYGADEKKVFPCLKLSSIWTWFRDCNLRSGCLTRAQIDMMVATPEQSNSASIHDGNRIILFRECQELLVRISAVIFAERAASSLSDALDALLKTIVLPRFTICSESIASNRARSSLDVSTRIAPFEVQLRAVFDQHKDHNSSTFPSITLFRLLLKSSIPASTILNAFNDTFRCDLTDNAEPVITPVHLATDQILYEEMLEIVGRSVMAILHLPDNDVDLANWIQTFCSSTI